MLVVTIFYPSYLNVLLIRESTTDEDKDKWIFFQQGGGWCYDSVTCLERTITSPTLTSSKGWSDSIKLEGIFDMV